MPPRTAAIRILLVDDPAVQHGLDQAT